LTFGLYVDELLQRADPAHRDTATLFKELVADPLGKIVVMETYFLQEFEVELMN